MRYILLYFFLYCLPVNAVNVPEPISICLWEAQISSDLQYGRKYNKQNDVFWHINTVENLLKADGKPYWYIKRVLEILDLVWMTYDIKDDESFVFKTTYNKCINEYKNADKFYYY